MSGRMRLADRAAARWRFFGILALVLALVSVAVRAYQAMGAPTP